MKQDFSLPPAPKRPLGEVNIWLTSIGLSLGLIMIFGLLGIIVVNGLEAFWPKTIHELTIAPSSKEEQPLVLYAGITKDQTRHVPADPARPGSTARDVREYQLFTGSKEIYGQSYRYVDAHNITAWNAWREGKPWSDLWNSSCPPGKPSSPPHRNSWRLSVVRWTGKRN